MAARLTRRVCAALGLLLAAGLVASCGTSSRPVADPGAAASSPPVAQTVAHKPLRPGEHLSVVRIPTPYTPKAPTGVGTDDYHCFLLDPGLSTSAFITGFNVLPDNTGIVHHVILFRVPPDQVAAAQAKDASEPGQGWTCFGTAGIGGGGGLDDAPWLGAWAPGGSEQLYGKGLGEPFAKGSRIIMQVHYNLLGKVGPDQSAAVLRWVPATSGYTPLLTQLLPAPVELPCAPGHTSGPLCTRAASLADEKARFGQGPASLADLLHLLCGPVRPGPVQSCSRPVTAAETVRGVAGHMHLLGQSIRIEVNPGKPDAKTLLDIRRWNFDDQGSHPIPPVHLKPGDVLKVTCRHSQRLHDLLPAFKGQPQKYVLWGEGTTDEMCLGILLVTRP